MIDRRIFLARGLATIGVGSAPAFAQSERFPNHLVRLVVPFAPGGAVDALARLLAERLKEKRGVSVTVENRAGANGTLGAAVVQHAPADG